MTDSLLTNPSGGSILTELIDKNAEDRYTLSALVRKPYQASILTDAGVTPLIFKDLDDIDVIREAAKDHDRKACLILDVYVVY